MAYIAVFVELSKVFGLTQAVNISRVAGERRSRRQAVSLRDIEDLALSSTRRELVVVEDKW